MVDAPVNMSDGIMIVDDELFFRELLRDMLTEEGFTVTGSAANGAEAVELYRTLHPALVLMDIYMPEENGIEATRDIIAMAPNAKILICSGIGYDDDADAALRAGARGVLFKPFYKEEVIAEIRKVLSAA